LLKHLLPATISVTLLIALVLGWRDSGVVLVAIPVTLALTLASFYFFGYTLNRVTLFALECHRHAQLRRDRETSSGGGRDIRAAADGGRCSRPRRWRRPRGCRWKS
jgi:hypothetical protein